MSGFTSDFNARVRAVLGVDDPTATVRTALNDNSLFVDPDATDPNPWCDIQIACAGRSRTFHGADAMAQVVRVLDLAFEEQPATTVARALGRAEPVLLGEVLVYTLNGRIHTGKIVAASNGSFTLRAEVGPSWLDVDDVLRIVPAPPATENPLLVATRASGQRTGVDNPIDGPITVTWHDGRSETGVFAPEAKVEPDRYFNLRSFTLLAVDGRRIHVDLVDVARITEEAHR